MMEGENPTERIPIRDLVRYFLRLGLLGFGGPVGHPAWHLDLLHPRRLLGRGAGGWAFILPN
jgi:chromate transport protein ChrA